MQKFQKVHKLNLALLRGDSEAEEQNIQETLDKTYPGVFAVVSGKAKCKVCVESFNLNRKNFFTNMDRHVDSKKTTRARRAKCYQDLPIKQ